MERNIFAGANTKNGFDGKFDTLISAYSLKKLFILKGGSGVGKSTLMKTFTNQFETDKDFIYCSADPSSLDGVIMPELGIGIIDGTAPHIVDPNYPGLIDYTIDLGRYINQSKLKTTWQEIKKIKDAKQDLYNLAYLALKKAWEKENQTTYKIDKTVASKIIKQISSIEKTSVANKNYKMFFSSPGPNGIVDFTSTLAKNIVYLDMPAKVAHSIFSKIKAHQYFAYFLNSSLITAIKINNTLFTTSKTPGSTKISTIGLYEPKNAPSTAKYINQACNHFKKAKELHQKLEQLYVPAMEFDLQKTEIEYMNNLIK